MKYRIEQDSMGEVRVPTNRYWGAQTQRSVENFPIGAGIETMPNEIIHAFGGSLDNGEMGWYSGHIDK